ncbi:TPA: hypothetical protein ACXDFY_002907 [Enterobacter roggenkampii]
MDIFEKSGVKDEITTPNIFKAIISFFPEVASRVKYKFNAEYSIDNFSEIIQPVMPALNKGIISKSKRSYKVLLDTLNNSLTKNFQL